MSCKLIYRDVAVGADTDATVSATSASTKSNISKLPFGGCTDHIASLELNHWGGSGNGKTYDGQEIALLSDTVSGGDCTFTVPPTIQFDFDSNYTTLGISFDFGTLTDDYCTNLTISWYHGTTLLSQKTFTPNATTFFCENTVEAFNKITVSFASTNLPGRYLRIEKVLFGIVREFGRSEMGSVTIKQEANPISATVSINYLDWKLKSKTGVDYIFQLKQPVEAYSNDTLLGVFYVDNIPTRTGENDYSVECQDALGVLDGYSYPDTIYTTPVLASTAIAAVVGTDFEVELDAAFAATTITGLISKGTKREAIQQIAFAIGAVVDTARSGKILIYPAAYTNPTAIPKSRVYTGGSVAQSAVVTKVIVTYHTYAAGSGTNGDDVVTVGGTKYVHTTGTVEVANPNVTASDKANEKTVADCHLINAGNAAAVAQRVYDYWAKRNTVSTRIVVDDEKPMEYVTVPTAWGTLMNGNFISANMKLSNTTAADLEVLS